ncbi:hypothetical protein [Devosia sp. SL43]|uniref:hypothetical protein n=1 Tax=Devosia sp. SL43 TaxID=2806348 RepID=UPI001F34F434|nr:hypothetical protein [Devosia sp. SL43]UJW84105.1 hypothetical protein IM737_11650 [Devosia sp. SL43]
MESFVAYIRQHRLSLRYGVALAFVLAVPLLLTLTGDPPELRGIKTIASIPVMIVLFSLPSIFGEQSTIAFTPSFIERGALTGMVIACWVAVLSWNPTFEPLRIILLTLLGFATYFGLHMLHGLRRRRPDNP